MYNKTLLKLAGLLFGFSVIDGFVILYWLLRCGQTQSSFYCDVFMFGGFFLSLGIPVLILLGLSLVTLVFSRCYKGNFSALLKVIIIIFGTIIFVAPYIPFLLPSEHPKTYQDYQNRTEQIRKDLEQQKIKRCEEYESKMSDWREGQPMPVPPPECRM